MKTLIAFLITTALLMTGCTSTNGKPNVTLNLTVQVAPVLPGSVNDAKIITSVEARPRRDKSLRLRLEANRGCFGVLNFSASSRQLTSSLSSWPFS